MKFSKLVAVLGVVVLSLGMGERCGAQVLYLETRVGDLTNGFPSIHPCTDYEQAEIQSITYDTALANQHGVSCLGRYSGITFQPKFAGSFQDDFSVNCSCSNSRGSRSRSAYVRSYCTAHEANSTFMSPSWGASVSCGYQRDSTQFGGFFWPMVWNYSEESVSIADWSLSLQGGITHALKIYDTIGGHILSSISLASHTKLAKFVVYLTVPDTLADSGVVNQSTLSCTVHRSSGDTTLTIPLSLILNANPIAGLYQTQSELDLPLASDGVGSGSTRFGIDGRVSSISLDSLSPPLHCAIAGQSSAAVVVKVWTDGGSKREYRCNLVVRGILNGAYAKKYQQVALTPVFLTQQVGDLDTAWDQLIFTTVGALYSFASSPNGVEFLYGRGVFRLPNRGVALDTLIDQRATVASVAAQSDAILTVIERSEYRNPQDPNFRNEIHISDDGGRHWGPVIYGPLVIDSNPQIPQTLNGFSPSRAWRTGDSVFYVIGSGASPDGSFFEYPFLTTDGGNRWRMIQVDVSPRDQRDAESHSWFESAPNGAILLVSEFGIDTLGAGFFAYPGYLTLSRRFPDGSVLYNSSSMIELVGPSGRATSLLGCPREDYDQQPVVRANSDSGYFSFSRGYSPTGDPAINRTDNGGVTWYSMNPGLAGDPSAFDLSLSGYAFAAAGKYIYRSKDLFPSAFRAGSQRVAAQQTPNASEALFRAYPNPASSLLTIEGSVRALRLELYDVLGRRINVEFKLSSERKRALLDLSTLPNAVYFIRIEYAGGVKTLLFRKES